MTRTPRTGGQAGTPRTGLPAAARLLLAVVAAALFLSGCAADGSAPIGGGGNGAQPAQTAAGGGGTAAPVQPYDIRPLLNPAKKFFGATFDGVPLNLSPVQQYATKVGRTPTLLEYYLGWGDALQADQTRAVWRDGQLPYIAWEPYKATMAQIAGGSQDAYIVSTAKTLRAINVPVAISLGHEMNGNWYPWGTKQSNAADFVKAWQHVHDVFQDQGVSTVIWVWSPNIVNPAPNVALKPYYPGDGYVDWVGVVGYYALTGAQNFSQLFGPTFSQIRTFTQRPFLLAETGSQPSPRKPGQITELLKTVADQPDVVGFIWFDLNKETDWRVDSSPDTLAAFRAGAANPAYDINLTGLK
ncbi:mannan endo-1,4-beta-mannosidase [Kitasatospora sp. GP30]|uniref:glycoside hydrolase family 26 protein n=1 Tax=Kitasatospora sp. GP30 TaxID=3035084 RepID=UPI000C705ED6|nr:glycosyl hydrolase [Kitasatospora sp. GP30]MDH6140923.1 mannan endo-1,4-beta-mannosidase [Kitasatospora sp. GP30]